MSGGRQKTRPFPLEAIILLLITSPNADQIIEILLPCDSEENLY